MAEESKNGHTPLVEALRTQIVEIVQKGDLTAEVLAKVVRVAKYGRDLLISLDPKPNLNAMHKRPGGFGFNSQSAMGSSDLPDDLSVDSSNSGTFAVPIGAYAPAPMPENFGMVAIRELVAMAKSLNGSSSPARLVEAIAIAKEKGLPDVVRELEMQLGIKKEKPAEAKVLEAPKKEATV